MDDAIPPVSRREFLYYIWAASTALLATEAGIGIVWYLSASNDISRRETLIHLKPDSVPKTGEPPLRHDEKRVWFSNTPSGFFAFHDYCTHLGCSVKWVRINQRFECPCHGAKFEADGSYIEGPARRDLDRFKVIATTPQGEVVTPASGGPIDITGATDVQVDLEVYLYGKSRR